MAIKLQRNYELRIETDVQNQFEVIRYPMTIDFNIQRDNLMGVNQGNFQIHNLNLNSRSKIRKDDWNFFYDKQIVFKAGYGQAVSICFDGKVQQAFSERQGVDFITTIDAFDNALQNTSATFSNQYKKSDNISYQQILNDVISQLQIQGIFPGAISSRYVDPVTGVATFLNQIRIQKDYTFNGNALTILRSLLPGTVFVDMGRLNYLNVDEYASSAIKVINSNSGLLGTPRQADNKVYVNILFEPGMVCGQKITLDSTESPTNNQLEKNFAFNGDYFVMGIKHSGTISGTIGGTLVTSLTLVKFKVSPKEVLGVQANV
jgi:hypothetical protein